MKPQSQIEQRTGVGLHGVVRRRVTEWVWASYSAHGKLRILTLSCGHTKPKRITFNQSRPPKTTVCHRCSQPSKRAGGVVLHRLVRRLTGDRWEVRKCLWPYPEGYATYNPGTRTILDTGLTKPEAQERCDQLNANFGD